MGQPKKQRRKYSTPQHMFKGREGEKELVQTYGLKNVKELWKAKSEVSRIRGLARKLLANPDKKTEGDILAKLVKVGLLQKESKLEDSLKLTVEDILNRRLQTVVYNRNLTITIKQARQEIVHGHIAVAGRRMNAPGHMTTLEEAETVSFYANSPLASAEHPVRKVEKKPPKEKKEYTSDRFERGGKFGKKSGGQNRGSGQAGRGGYRGGQNRGPGGGRPGGPGGSRPSGPGGSRPSGSGGSRPSGAGGSRPSAPRS